MTREEAISFLIKDKEQRGDCFISEAIDMAIKALEQEPCEECKYNTKPRHAVCNSCICGDRYVKDEGFEELDFVQPHKKIEVNLVPCEDAISRQAVLDIDFRRIILTTAKPAEIIEQKIKTLPPVNPQPKTGHWIPLGNYDDFGNESSYKCSECGDLDTYPDNFCPNCGTRMIVVEPQKSEDKE